MFHKGAEIPGDFPNLQGDGKEARTFKVGSLDDLDAKSEELIGVFRAWIAMKDG